MADNSSTKDKDGFAMNVCRFWAKKLHKKVRLDPSSARLASEIWITGDTVISATLESAWIVAKAQSKRAFKDLAM